MLFFDLIWYNVQKIDNGRNVEAMTDRKPRGDMQARILAYIEQEIRTRGYAPSVREIGEAVGLKSTSTVHGHLTRMEKKGLLRRVFAL